MKIGFVKGQVDPCLIYRRNSYGLCIIALYVDDCLCVGDSHALDKAISDIRKIFDIKVENKVSDYLGCNIQENQDSTFIHQKHTYEHLKEKFLSLVTRPSTNKIQSYSTPGTPGFRIVRALPEDPTLPSNQQKLYRSGVGILLYLVKHTRPDLANPV